MFFRLADVGACQPNSVRASRKTPQALEPVLHKTFEPEPIAGGPVQEAIAMREPEGRNLRTIDTLPEKLRRDIEA